MEKIYAVSLYLSTPSTGGTLFDAVQGDTCRKLQASIYNDDGTAFVPEQGIEAEYWSLKPDGNSTQHSAIISGNVVNVDFIMQDLACPGKVYATIILKDGDDILAAMPFWFMVHEVPMGQDIESTSEYQIMVEATNAANEATDNANNAAGKGPYIRQSDLHWMRWNNDAGEYEDTGVPAAGYEGIVLYSAAQELTSTQKAQARSNIGAASAAAVEEISEAVQDLQDNVGDIHDLDTSAADLVGAINEVKSDLETAESNLKNIISDQYDNTATYKVGDYCIHDNVLYKCTTAIATAENWTAAHWTATTIAAEIKDRVLWLPGITVSAITGDIIDLADSRITPDHVLARCDFANDSYITDPGLWSTETAGTLKISGTCSTATTADVLLVKKNN